MKLKIFDGALVGFQNIKDLEPNVVWVKVFLSEAKQKSEKAKKKFIILF